MQINVRAPQSFLEEFRLHLEDEFEKNEFMKGPKVGSVESGHMETFIKGDIILILQIKEESDRESVLLLESEQDIPGMKEMWDRAVVEFSKKLIDRLRRIAQNPDFVEKELKQP